MAVIIHIYKPSKVIKNSKTKFFINIVVIKIIRKEISNKSMPDDYFKICQILNC